jgi:hypothetical protein
LQARRPADEQLSSPTGANAKKYYNDFTFARISAEALVIQIKAPDSLGA